MTSKKYQSVVKYQRGLFSLPAASLFRLKVFDFRFVVILNYTLTIKLL